MVLFVCVVASLLLPIGANNFVNINLESRGDRRILAEELKHNLFMEISESIGKRKLDRIQLALRPTYAALPKDAHGNLERSAVRYALHRYFVQQNGWYLVGLRPSDGAWNASLPDAITKDRVPAYLQDIFEQRLGRHGFGMHELAVFAATLEDLIHTEAIANLQTAYSALQVDKTARVPSKVLDVIINAYMMSYITCGNLSSVSRQSFIAQEQIVKEIYPSCPRTRMFVRDMRKSVEHTERHKRNVFKGGLSFDDAVRVVEEVGRGFGPFQALECHGLKQTLLEREHKGTGRVYLSKIYEHRPVGVLRQR